MTAPEGEDEKYSHYLLRRWPFIQFGLETAVLGFWGFWGATCLRPVTIFQKEEKKYTYT